MNWHPAKFFTDVEPETPYALLLLNQSLNEPAYKRVVDHGMPLPFAEEDLLITPASMITCVDGGANQLYDILQLQNDIPGRVSRSGHNRFAWAHSGISWIAYLFTHSSFLMLSLGI